MLERIQLGLPALCQTNLQGSFEPASGLADGFQDCLKLTNDEAAIDISNERSSFVSCHGSRHV
jgi:hypothetical protein